MQLTTNLIDICYDCSSGLRTNPASNELDIEQATDQLDELRDVLARLLKTTTAGVHLPGSELLVDQVNDLLSRCRSELNTLEAALKQESGKKKVKGPTSSLDWGGTLTTLGAKTNTLRGIMETNRR